MKTKKSIITTLFFLVIFSCSSSNDDEATTETQPNLVNKWSLTVWKLNNVNQTLTSCDQQGYIQFNTNGTFERKDYSFSSGNCILEGNENGTYSYNSSNHKITLNFVDNTDGPQTEILNNVEFTTSKLNYSWDEDGNGTDEHYLEYTKN